VEIDVLPQIKIDRKFTVEVTNNISYRKLNEATREFLNVV
jgi:hypothetical protein